MRTTLFKIILLNLVLSTFSIFAVAMPVYAVTACQNVQMVLNNLLKNPPSQNCKYAPEFGDTEIKVWLECDYRPTTIKTITYSSGSVDNIQSSTAYCCYKTTGCYIESDLTLENFTTTRYKTSVKKEYCDGHIDINEWPCGSIPNRWFMSQEGRCGNPGWSNTDTSQVEQQNTNCSSQVFHSLYTTLSIPSDCNGCAPDDKCCQKPNDPCCVDPKCCGAVCCQQN